MEAIIILNCRENNHQMVNYADVGRIGIGICYDIRFQELAMIYASRGFPSSLFLIVLISFY